MKRWVSLVLSFLLLLLVFGCASNRVTVVDPRGRPLPSPHYNLFSDNMFVTFYYSFTDFEKDLDGTELSVYSFLPLNKFHYFNINDIIILNIEVTNPNQIEYKVIEKIRFDEGRKETGKTIGYSNKQYRMYSIGLPTENVFYVNHYVEVQNKEQLVLFRIGDFNYKIKEIQ